MGGLREFLVEPVLEVVELADADARRIAVEAALHGFLKDGQLFVVLALQARRRLKPVDDALQAVGEFLLPLHFLFREPIPHPGPLRLLRAGFLKRRLFVAAQLRQCLPVLELGAETGLFLGGGVQRRRLYVLQRARRIRSPPPVPGRTPR